MKDYTNSKKLYPVRREEEQSNGDGIFPNVVDLEADLLAALVMSPREILNVIGVVHPADFYRDFHREVYEAMVRLYTEKQGFDVILLEHELEKQRKLSADESSSLWTWRDGVVFCNAKEYAQRITDTAVLRRLVEAGHEIFKIGHTSKDASEALSSAEQVVYNVASHKSGSDIKTSRELVPGFIQELDARREMMRQGFIAGISTGFSDLDKMISGFRKGHLTLLGALSSDGKSALALQFALNVARQGKNVLFFSLEMPHDEVLQRITANITGLDNTDIGNGDYTDEEWDKFIVPAAGKIEELPIAFDETANITVSEIRAKCLQYAMRVREKGGLGLVVVDYLQLIQAPTGTKNENRATVIGEIARDLKILAADLQVPILCPAQLTREVEKQNRRPKMSDMADSSGLEKNANEVLMLYRPSRNDPSADERVGILIVAKCRNGKRGEIGLHVDLSKMRFLPGELMLQEEEEIDE
jgi:replicative DNA helicase